MSRLIAAAISSATALSVFVTPAFAQQTSSPLKSSPISIVDIGGLGATNGLSIASAITNGIVVGSARIAGGQSQFNAVESTGGPLIDIGAGFYSTAATAVNASGTAVGQVSLSDGSQPRAVVFANRRQTQLGTLPGDASSSAAAINDRGVIVGTSASANGTTQAFEARDDRIEAISPIASLPGLLGSNATGINNSGTIVGSLTQKITFGQRSSSFVLSGTKLTTFANVFGFGFGVSQPTAVNSAGVVAGYHSTFSFSANAPVHAYTFANGKLIDYGTLYPTQAFAISAALGINSAGVAVGYSAAYQSPLPRATLYVNGKITDLNAILPSNSGWLLATATGIDDRGDIVGIGFHNAIQRGFILRTGALYAPSHSATSPRQ